MIRLEYSSSPADLRRPPSLDRRRVEAWTAEIVAGAPSGLEAAFGPKGGRGPAIVWQPPVERLAAPQLRFLLRYWTELAGSRTMPRARDIDALEMRAALGYVNLLDVIEDGEDFRYRVFGSVVAAVSGYDMGGQPVSTLKASPHIIEFTLASYRAAAQRGEPLLTEYRPPAPGQTVAWHTLVLPLADAGGATIRLLVGSVPLARDGRPISLRL